MFVIPWMCDYSDTTLFSICQNESVRIFSIDELEMIIGLYAINASSHYYQNAWHMYLRMFNDHILIRSDYAARQLRPPIALRTDLSHITTELWEIQVLRMAH